jgi:hypothetical protein
MVMYLPAWKTQNDTSYVAAGSARILHLFTNDGHVQRGVVWVNVWDERLRLPVCEQLLLLLLGQLFCLETAIAGGDSSDEKPHNPRDQEGLQKQVVRRNLR